MSQPAIKFGDIRPHHGSQQHGFEELCCQLASLDTHPTADTYHRKGVGADAGVECFVTHASGDETGWQAKYFFTLDAAQLSQLDKSVEQALTKHPNLKRYVVCIPFNLRDARTGKAKTEQERWADWKKKWIAQARKQKRALAIDLWDETELIRRLTQSDAHSTGRLQYWFDRSAFGADWFKQRFEIAKAGLGDRYTPETNVELPIRQALLALGRDPSIQKEIDAWFVKLEEARYRAVDSAGRILIDSAGKKTVAALDTAAGKLARELSFRSREAGDDLALDIWDKATSDIMSASHACSKALWNWKPTQEKDKADDADYAKHALRQLEQALYTVQDALNTPRWQTINARKLLVYGDAGVGKSHLFGDAASHCIAHGHPVILALGSHFVDGDPWRQILDQLGLQNYSSTTFLSSLDAVGQATNTRALILIDAINERKGIDVWPSRLAAFIQSMQPFRYVAVAVSCRSTYLPFVVPDSITEKQLPRIEHVGFAGRAGEAARTYLDRRGIVRMAAPNLIPEFENPLFLKTCCDFLKKENKTEFPRGLRGVTQIFDFYFSAVARQIETRLQLDPRQGIVAKAIAAFAGEIDKSGQGFVEAGAATTMFEALLPSHGVFEKSLLSQLESEGMLVVEPLTGSDGAIKQYVRFTFERYSDHRIASRLLDQYLTPTDSKTSFAVGMPLYDFVVGADAPRHMGVIEAIAIQLPERTELELPDAPAPGHKRDYLLLRAFHQSVLWRDQKCFRKRTLELLKTASRFTGQDEVTRTLVAVATEPENAFNAHYLHKLLAAKPMPDRDVLWSTFAADELELEDSHLQTLIAWTAANGMTDMEEARAELAAILLAWTFTLSHRQGRDRATKALVALLTPRLALAGHLIKTFGETDDLYVVERVLASAYGAALQGMQPEALGALAALTFDCVFAKAQPVVHIVIRDYARGIVELAHARGVLPKGIDLQKARPPYKSPWPLEEVSEAKIQTYTEKYPGGIHTDRIVSSCVNDGDFARYEIDYGVGHWSNLPLSMIGKTEDELFRTWAQETLAAVPQAAKPLKDITTICDRLRDAQKDHPLIFSLTFVAPDPPGTKKKTGKKAGPTERAPSPQEKKIRTAEDRLEKLLGKERWEGYCNYARHYLHRDIHGLMRYYSWPPHVPTGPARRWVCKRVHDLGWSPERFSTFDGNISGGRHEHRIERIGKKYQWIALHELLAHLADNTAFTNHRQGLGTYRGPWQVGARDIDPSILADSAHGDGWRQWDATWWMPIKVKLESISREARLAWLDSDDDIFNDASLIEITDPNGTEWLVIDEYAGWHQWGLERGERTYERLASFGIRCVLVRAADRAKLVKALTGRRIREHDLPSLDFSSDGFIGEYCWHPLYRDTDGWAAADSWSKIPVATQPTEITHSARRGEFDCSMPEAFDFKVPAPGLVKGMDLRLRDGKALSYADKNGRIVFFDPSTGLEGPSAGLVERKGFTAFLKREKLEAIWIVSAEKEVFGGKKHDNGWGGEREFFSLYWITPEGWARVDHEQRKRPTKDQLERYFAEDGLAIKAPPRGKSRTKK